MNFIRRRSISVSLCFLFLFLLELVTPTAVYALTSGPTQPEVESFSPIGMSDMVDKFTGDFSYNIPLMEVDGYPLNISYNAGITMDQEASWVGLGWNLNPGSINRGMRGLPDDFKGDELEHKFNMRPNTSIGLSMKRAFEIFGSESKYKKTLQKWVGGKIQSKASLGIVYNSYNGVSLDLSLSPTWQGNKITSNIPAAKAELNFNFSGEEGLSISPNAEVSFVSKIKKKSGEIVGGIGFKTSASGTYNSRIGMKQIGFGLGVKSKNSEYTYGQTARHMFGLNSYTPTIVNPMKSFSFSFNIASGKEVLGVFYKWPIQGSFSTQWVSEKEISKKAYGFMYLDNKDDGEEGVVLDINRENDNTISEKTSKLPLPVSTFDFFTATGQGISGVFRAYRSDITNYSDYPSNSMASSASVGLEFGALEKIKAGLNLGVNVSTSTSGNWVERNELQSRVRNVTSYEMNAHPEYEPYYFKDISEIGISNIHMEPHLQAYYRISPVGDFDYLLSKWNVERNASVFGDAYFSDVDGDPSNNVKTERQVRNKVFIVKTADQASVFGLNQKLQNFGVNQLPVAGAFIPNYTIARVSEYRKENHISEIEILNTEGVRYVYGVPVYNIEQTDYSFSIGQGNNVAGNCNTCLATYQTDDIDPRKNTNGKEELVQSAKIPGYAHSFLLSAVLSPDYIDLTGNGVTDDDLGSATKFNYTRISDIYQWRTPVGEMSANFIEGKRSDYLDDKGSFSFGKKELWYVHSVEGKNHIAMFYISTREDGRGVGDVDGGQFNSGGFQYKLDSVVLYNKQDFIQNGINAYKIKGVHFEYDYVLCGEVPNFTPSSPLVHKGKLTLKKLYFTYGNSYKSKHSPYVFSYNNEITPSTPHVDYKYSTSMSDRWGTYQKNGTADCEDPVNLNNSEFPYTIQNKSTADEYAAAWSLKEVRLPSGGIIKIELEADDYGFVQDKAAMTMYKIHGFAETPSDYGSSADILYDKTPYKIYKTMFIELGQSTTPEELDRIIRGMGEIQVTVLADISGKGISGSGRHTQEYVKAYVEMEDENAYGLVSGNDQVAYIIMKTVKLKDGDSGRNTNPISKTIWNWTRLHAPEIVFNQKMTNNYGLDKAFGFIYELVGLYNEVVNTSIGMYGNFRIRGLGKKIKLDKSWVRLRARERTKLGGGYRVKSIKVSDEWATIGAQNTGAANFEYGLEYDYSISEEILGSEVTHSSGVASYEPSIGADENPFTYPEYYNEELKGVPDLAFMNDRPLGEAFFPAAAIGYRKVTSRALQHANVQRTATGYTVSEFYTAKDFPTFRTYSLNNIHQTKTNFALQLFSPVNKTQLTESQGFLIAQNDMHGKGKAEYVYSEYDHLISGTEYIYQTENDKGTYKLNNTVMMLSKDGSIVEKELGTSVEVYNDFREMESVNQSVQWSGDIDFIVYGAWPALIPSLYGLYNQSSTKIQTAATVKVINRKGILKSIIAIKEGSHIRTDNLLYDAETGNVLVTSVDNEFQDKITNVNYPAHWAYENGVGSAYKNIDLVFQNVEILADTIKLEGSLNPRDYFVPGDMCLVENPKTGDRKICDVYQGNDYMLNLILHGSGKSYVPDNPADRFRIRIIRSGRRNLLSSSIQSVSMKHQPIQGTTGNYYLGIDSVLAVSAVEYSDYWPFFCDRRYSTNCDTIYNFDRVNLKDMLNEIATSMRVTGGGVSLDLDCAVEKFTDKGFITDGNLYKKLFPDGDEEMVQITADSCFECVDSLFIDAGDDEYVGISQAELIGCKTQCCTAPVNVETFVPNHAGFEDYRNALQDVAGGTCVTDTNLQVYLQSCNSFIKDEGLVKLTFSRCDETCELELKIPNNTCYRKISSFDNVWYHYQDDKMYVSLTLELIDGSTKSITTTLTSNCINFREVDCTTTCENTDDADVLSPYQLGIKGNWRIFRNWVFNDQRDYYATERPRTDGTYKNFTTSKLFWRFDAGDNEYQNTSPNSRWIASSEVTLIDPYGNQLENKDALDRYSSALYGFNNTIPVAVAANTRFNELAFESFEENNNFWINQLCQQDHLDLKPDNPLAADYTTDYAHSGKYSLKVLSGQALSKSVDISACSDAGDPFNDTEFEINSCECVGRFNPKTGKYIVSAWVKQGDAPTDTTYLGSKVQLKTKASGVVTNTFDLIPQGPIIDGWQRVFAEIEIVGTDDEIEVSLSAASNQVTYFDDFRFHPFNSTMKSYAYDQITLRLMAELDENNFATFYEYDQEGNLIRVKKETVRGIATLKEVKKHIVKE